MAMQPSNEDYPSSPDRQTNATARRNVSSPESAVSPSLQQIQVSDPDFDATRTNIRNASSAVVDTLSRLQQIRNALRDLDDGESTTNRTGEQSTRDTSILNPEPHIGPSHSAILLSEEDNSAPVDPEVLRNRLDELGADLPEYMRAAANIIRNMAHGTNSQSRDDTGSPRGSNASSRQPADAVAPRVHTRTSDAASGRYARPRRDSNPISDGGTGYRRQENNRDNESANVPTARRVASRDDDSASTLLGRRVASRTAAAAAARSSGNTPADQRSRALPSPRSLLSEHYRPPGSVSGSTSTSRIIVPPRLPDRVSRRIAQFESTVHERHRRVDSEGSETEVDDYVLRPIVVRRGIENRAGARDARQRTDSGAPPLSLPDLIPVSPFSSPGRTRSTGPSSSDSSPRPAEEESSDVVFSHMQDVYGRLNRLSNVLSVVPRGMRPAPSSFSGGDLDGALFLRPTDRDQEGENSYQEVIEADEGRTYRIRRRINADGDEQVHQISTDAWWDVDNDLDSVFPSTSTAASRERRFAAGREDDPWSRYPPGPGASATNVDNDTMSTLERLRRQRHGRIQAFQNQRSETDLPPLNADLPPQNINIATRRRRGWARLDPDGDEIPTDEEEEIERVRTEQRVRNSQTAWRSVMSASTTRARLEYLAPTTRSVFSHTTDEDEEGENDVRVRLQLPPGQSARRITDATFAVFSDPKKEKGNDPEAEQEFFGTSEPYYINPLPMPLEQMEPRVSGSLSQSQSTRTGLAKLRHTEMAAR